MPGNFATEVFNNMETVHWKVEGMTCANCSLAVTNYLQKQGAKEVKVNLINGDVSFVAGNGGATGSLSKGIHDLGYTVIDDKSGVPVQKKRLFRNHLHRFLFCLVFTIPLMLHMFERWFPIHWLMNPWIQFALALPVYIVGMDFFWQKLN